MTNQATTTTDRWRIVATLPDSLDQDARDRLAAMVMDLVAGETADADVHTEPVAGLGAAALAEIEARAAAATPAPWAIWHDLDHQGHYTVGEASGVVPEGQRFADGRAVKVACVANEADAEFIVATRQHVLDLVVEVRRRQRDKQAGMRREAAILRWAAERLDSLGTATVNGSWLRRWADEFAAGTNPNPTTEETR